MADVYLRKTLTGYMPADEASCEIHRKHKLGETYRADIVKPRSYQAHKLCMALIDLTYTSLPEKYHRLWPTPRVFRRMLADAVGHVEEYYSQDGEKKTNALSLSYDDIPDQVTHHRIFGDMMAVCAHLLGIEDMTELQREVEQYASHHGQAA